MGPRPGTVAAKRTCKPSSVPLYVNRGQRSFIWDRCYHRPQATYPRVERSGPLLLFYLVFLRVGFTELSPSPAKLVSSYLTFSPLPPPERRRYIFCGTFLGVTPTGRYPAPCPVELGLSSNALCTPAIAPSALPSTALSGYLYSGGNISRVPLEVKGSDRVKIRNRSPCDRAPRWRAYPLFHSPSAGCARICKHRSRPLHR